MTVKTAMAKRITEAAFVSKGLAILAALVLGKNRSSLTRYGTPLSRINRRNSGDTSLFLTNRGIQGVCFPRTRCTAHTSTKSPEKKLRPGGVGMRTTKDAAMINSANPLSCSFAMNSPNVMGVWISSITFWIIVLALFKLRPGPFWAGSLVIPTIPLLQQGNACCHHREPLQLGHPAGVLMPPPMSRNPSARAMRLPRPVLSWL